MINEQINIGDFNEQVTWRQPTAAKDSKGQVIRSFVDYRTDWVAIAHGAQSEAETANKMGTTDSLTITAHYEAAIDNTWQAVYNGNEYNLMPPMLINNRRFMKINAIKLVK